MNNYVIVLCSQKVNTPKEYCDSAYVLGKLLAEAGKTTVFGGAFSGSTGRLADGVAEVGGQLISSLPLFMREKHEASLHPKVTYKHWQEYTYPAKQELYAKSDAVVCLPGGINTVQELLTVFLMKREGTYSHPVIVVNQDGFYSPLQSVFSISVEKNLLDKNAKIIDFVDTVEEAMDIIRGQRKEAPALATAN